MENEKFKARDVQPTVLRLHPDVRAKLMRIATTNGRSLSKEIETRLRESLKDTPAPGIAPGTLSITYPTAHQPAANHTGEFDKSTSPPSDLDRAMLHVFHALPVEKQLALLSLFK